MQTSLKEMVVYRCEPCRAHTILAHLLLKLNQVAKQSEVIALESLPNHETTAPTMTLAASTAESEHKKAINALEAVRLLLTIASRSAEMAIEQSLKSATTVTLVTGTAAKATALKLRLNGRVVEGHRLKKILEDQFEEMVLELDQKYEMMGMQAMVEAENLTDQEL